MSKKQKNTLLNYFQSPKTQKVKEASTSKTADSDEEYEVQSTQKRRRLQVIDDSSDSDNGSIKHTIKKRKPVNSSSSENENTTPNKPRTLPKKTATRNDSNKEKTKKTSLHEYKFKNGNSLDPSTSSQSTGLELTPQAEMPRDIHSNWKHNKLEFLKPEKIMDAKRRRPDDPEYNPKTLYVPESFLKDLTPAMRQWWDLKSEHMDAVLFFKVGKFYELYHMDAVIGVTELGFSYMKGDFAHSGFPETAYGKMANMLLERGYKVARCEQTETPDMMDKRCKSMVKCQKQDRVVRREICQVSVKGSTIYNAQLSEPQNYVPNYMYAVNTKPLSKGNFRIGICFVETSLGQFYLSEFDDDRHFSKLLTLFAEFPAVLILTQRGESTKNLAEMLKTHFVGVRQDSLLTKSQFFTASQTLEELKTACYFQDKEGTFQWPEFFKQIADDCLPKEHAEQAVSSLGACLWYLKDSKIDIQVFMMSKFQWYDPLDLNSRKTNADKDYLILDATTIKNLNLFDSEDSLQKTVDHCETAFGKRLLYQWICRPLCNVDKIERRQKAVSELINNPTLLKNAKQLLKTIPDLERLLTKIHTYGNRFVAKDHPDSRAILYEVMTYNKKKIKDFIRTLKAFERLQKIPSIFEDCDALLLRKLTRFEPDSMNLDLSEILTRLKNTFNFDQAEKEGTIIPVRGNVDDYDEIELAIENIKLGFDDYLNEQSKVFGCKVTYSKTIRNRYQIEVPANRCDKATYEHRCESASKGGKGIKRYSTPKTKALLAELVQAETNRSKIILDLNRRIFESFGEEYDKFSQVIQCVALLDALCSLAEYARTFSQEICIPEVVPFSDTPYIVIENGRHPCSRNIDTFVPNDTKLGIEMYPNLLILTGPNMGGKTTLMRQVLVLSIMAQLGSAVPASKCRLTLVDRIFTRIGASDDLVKGRSTFFVELGEASIILQHATKDSMVLVDELGRGTSTHDGNAIATAYAKKLSTIKCRSMFSTHYNSLVDNFIGRDDIQLGYMDCMVENNDDPSKETVTFLYKMAQGKCPKSYGFNTAKLAGVDSRIIQRGREIAANLEREANLRRVFQTVFRSDDLSSIRNALASLKF